MKIDSEIFKKVAEAIKSAAAKKTATSSAKNIIKETSEEAEKKVAEKVAKANKVVEKIKKEKIATDTRINAAKYPQQLDFSKEFSATETKRFLEATKEYKDPAFIKEAQEYIGSAKTKDEINIAKKISKQMDANTLEAVGTDKIRTSSGGVSYKEGTIPKGETFNAQKKYEAIKAFSDDSKFNDYSKQYENKFKQNETKNRILNERAARRQTEAQHEKIADQAATFLNHKYTKTAIGLGVGAFALSSVFGNHGQQTNAQLYSQQGQQY